MGWCRRREEKAIKAYLLRSPPSRLRPPRNVAHIQEGLLVFGRRWSDLCAFCLLIDISRSAAFVWTLRPGLDESS